ncbi:MAG: bacteriocin [Bacteroidaceae bacterium]|nr:bacteriocin [Bacteroidaceae bacterium]
MAKEEKRVVQFEINDNVKKMTITGEDKDQRVVMREELSEEELDEVSGGGKLGSIFSRIKRPK